MARMSVDDMLGRDPRLLRLAKACGWSRRETAGALVLDVWPLCYDRERPDLADADVDIAAGIDGFAQMMVDAELAARVKPGRVRVAGARKRIKYLQAKRDAGYHGGLKSAESRGKRVKQNSSTTQANVNHGAKQTASTPQASGNPSDPVPVLVSDPVPVGVCDQTPTPIRTNGFSSPFYRVSTDGWALAARAHLELKAAGIDSDGYAWPGLPAGSGKDAAVERAKELLEIHGSTVESALATVRRAVDFRVAEARAQRTLRWFIPSRFWAHENFWRAAESSPQQAADPRKPAQAAKGRVEPKSADDYPEGDQEL